MAIQVKFFSIVAERASAIFIDIISSSANLEKAPYARLANSEE
jgi:hypothetical protein